MSAAVEAIAIIGLGGRFPGAPTPDRFWEMIRDGVDAITEVPPDRWDIEAVYDPDMLSPGTTNSRWGGFLEGVGDFDTHFFGVSPYEARQMDPQQRLLLEVAWETLEQAAIDPRRTALSQTGVFVGVRASAYLDTCRNDYSLLNAYSVIGNLPSAAANRLSAFFNWRGPCMAVDTACSSALVAIHLACQSLWAGESDMALAGGVNLILSPFEEIAMAQGNILASDGRCKSFDAAGDGYVRSEGCGLVLLQRLSDARQARHQIMAVIPATAVNHGGRGTSFVAPNRTAIEALIRQVLRRANLGADQLDYVEAHGVGGAVADSSELQALGALFDNEVPSDHRNHPCWVGSVKTNIGHSELASGSASLLKVVLALQHEQLPANLHFTQLHPDVTLDHTPLRILTEPQPWPTGVRPRRALVSSFGAGGTNAQLVVAEAPRQPRSTPPVDRNAHLLALSARSEAALLELAGRYAHHLTTHPDLPLADICYSTNVGRAHFTHRLAVVAQDTSQLCAQLVAFANGSQTRGLWCGTVEEGRRPRLAFLFPDGPQHALGPGYHLYEGEPTFRTAIDRCAALMQPALAQPLQVLLFQLHGMPPGTSPVTTALASFALEYALAQLWQGWGLVPDVVLGQGVGALVAAHVAGIMQLEDAVRLLVEQGAAPQTVPADVVLEPPQMAFVSTLDGQLLKSGEVPREGLWQHIGGSVDVQRGLEGLGAAGSGLGLVLGAVHPASLAAHPPLGIQVVGGWDAMQPDWVGICNTLAVLAINGVSIDWERWDRAYERQRLRLPTYPFQRKRYWLQATVPETPPDPLLRANHVTPLSQPESASGHVPTVALKTAAHPSEDEVAGYLQTTVANLLSHPSTTLGWQQPLTALGFDSLMGIELRSRLGRDLGVELPLEFLIQDPTLEMLTQWVGERHAHPLISASGQAPSYPAAWLGAPAKNGLWAGDSVLVNIQSTGTAPPLFCITAGYGDLVALMGLARLLGPSQPFYGLRPALNKPHALAPRQLLQAQVESYLHAIRSVQPTGPYVLAGYSSGGLVAFEVAQQLYRQHETVALLALLDTPFRFSALQYRLHQAIEPFRMLMRLYRFTRGAHAYDVRALLDALLSDPGLAAHLRATSGYEPHPYPGRITFFLAQIPYWGYGRFHRRWPDEWRRVAAQGVDLRPVAGTHYTMLRQPAVQHLAAQLSLCLAQVQPMP